MCIHVCIYLYAYQYVMQTNIIAVMGTRVPRPHECVRACMCVRCVYVCVCVQVFVF